MTKMNESFLPQVPVLAPAKAMGQLRFLLHHRSLLSQHRTQVKEHGKCEVVLTDNTVWEVTTIDGVLWSLQNSAGHREIVSPLRIKHRASDKWDYKS